MTTATASKRRRWHRRRAKIWTSDNVADFLDSLGRGLRLKRALLVGIDYYEHFAPLYGCANDAEALLRLLAKNEDGGPNLHDAAL